MEKFTIRSAFSEVSLYARWAVSPAAGKPAAQSAAAKTLAKTIAKAAVHADDMGAPAKAQALGKAGTARNADGDTFTFSIEARAIQVSESIRIGTGRDRKRTHGERQRLFPRLTDAEDVAARAAEDWDREFAVRKGSRREFADALRAKLDRWAAGGADDGHIRLEHREFRNEVAVSIRMRLENWVGAENPEGAPDSAPENPSLPQTDSSSSPG